MPALNGWTSARLDDLARDVAEIKAQLSDRRAAELDELKLELKEARARPHKVMAAYLIPFFAGLVPTLLIIFVHHG